ncbi:MAG TPA: right-handed parallel beta-helix repeat-containing protein, partial [Spirochaetota bacterium]|nr:right-handed parallel beta-helix repeat-containing protein [Spirochaetota bacterium]
MPVINYSIKSLKLFLRFFLQKYYLFLLFLTLLVYLLPGQTLTVSNIDTSVVHTGQSAIEDAMYAASTNQTLYVFPGTYNNVTYKGDGPGLEEDPGIRVVALSWVLSNDNSTVVIDGGLNTVHLYYTHSITFQGVMVTGGSANGFLVENICSNTSILNCRISNCNIGIDADFEEADSCRFISNTIIDSVQWGIRTINADNALILRNLIFGTSGNGINIDDSSTGMEIYHNTVVNNTGNGLYIYNGTHTVYNNIFAHNGSGSPDYGINLAGGSITEGYNIFYNNTDGPVSGFTVSATDITTDPMLSGMPYWEITNTNSSAWNSATNLNPYSSPYADGAPDIGYFEYG